MTALRFLPEAEPEAIAPRPGVRDLEVAEVAGRLVAEFRFAEAAALLRGRVRELAEARETRLQRLFAEGLELPAEERKAVGFWEWSHGRDRDCPERGPFALHARDEGHKP